jgi:S1-C subfamily serine protease
MRSSITLSIVNFSKASQQIRDSSAETPLASAPLAPNSTPALASRAGSIQSIPMASDIENWSIPAEFRPRPDDFSFDLAWGVSSSVGLRATVPEDAYTAGILGSERIGHGVAIDGEGTVLTIGYLITEADQVWLTTGEKDVVSAYVLGIDQATGFGLVRAVHPLPVPPIDLGHSREAAIGDHVIIAGGGRLDRSIGARVVARQRFAGYWEYLLDEALFTAPAHPLWSGAPMIGRTGKLLGIGSLQLQERTGEGHVVPLNMVVPIELLLPILDDLMVGRPSADPRPWLGVLADDSDDRVVILGATPGGPAQRAELRTNDSILAVGETNVSSLAEFYRALWASGPPGTRVQLTVEREGDVFDVLVTTRDRRALLKAPMLH